MLSNSLLPLGSPFSTQGIERTQDLWHHGNLLPPLRGRDERSENVLFWILCR